MKPNTPEQLARFLDQISGSYPYGIPREVIRVVSVPADDAGIQEEIPLRYHILVIGEEAAMSEAACELLHGITSKGLRVDPSQYLLSFVRDEDVESSVDVSPSPNVIVFGARRPIGWVERARGGPILFTSSLEDLINEAGLKKALWRELQKLL
jgi:hypothetical protein